MECIKIIGINCERQRWEHLYYEWGEEDECGLDEHIQMFFEYILLYIGQMLTVPIQTIVSDYAVAI